jgi:hypothetical protein
MVADHQVGQPQGRLEYDPEKAGGEAAFKTPRSQAKDDGVQRLGARHADRHRGDGNQQGNRERQRRKEFDAGSASLGNGLPGNGGRETVLPGQLSHGRSILGESALGESACCIAEMSRRSWAMPLKNKGASVFFG